MDQLRKRLGHSNITYEELEDELEYNFKRKEDLKKEVRNIQEKYDDLYEIYVKNTKAAMDLNVENAGLRADLDKEKKENCELNSENNESKAIIKSLEEEVQELEKSKNDIYCLPDIQSRNIKLEEIIESMKEDEEKIFSDLKESNQNLQIQIENFLKCDDCEDSFDNKALIFNHMKSVHSGRTMLDSKCVLCDERFTEYGGKNRHMRTEHGNKMKKDKLVEKLNELELQIKNQKIKIYGDILKLKQKESREKVACSCKGSFCQINHGRYRWTISKSDLILGTLNISNEKFFGKHCQKCGEMFNEEDDIKVHIETHHNTNVPLICHQCDKSFSDDRNLTRHIETNHRKNILESTFFNPSLVNSE